MTPLKEIRTIHACPLVGKPDIPTRANTTTFQVGASGCDKLELDEARGLAIATGAWRSVAVPVGQCAWVEFQPASAEQRSQYPLGASEPSPKDRDMADHGTGVAQRGALAEPALPTKPDTNAAKMVAELQREAAERTSGPGPAKGKKR